MKNLLGVDFGTTSLKACLFNEEGELLCSEAAQYELITRDGFVEFPAEEFFRVFESVVSRITARFPVYAMSIDTQGETMIVLDRDGKPLMNAIIWLDNRAQSQAGAIEEHFTLRVIYERTGQAEVPAGYPAPKILWLKEMRPDVFTKAAHYVLLEDYILFRLTGRFVASRSLYASSLLMDARTGGYFEEMLAYLGIREDQLSTLQESGTFVGEYNGIKVMTGALDQIAGVTGAGAVREGMMCETTGTALAVSVLTNRMPAWREGVNLSAYYVRQGLYCLLLWAPTAGATLEWFKKNFCAEDYAKLNELAQNAPAGCEGLICVPHLCGTVVPDNSPEVKGVFFGMTLAHGKGHFVRAIMESVAYTVREFCDFLQADTDEIRCMGGGAKSELWCAIKSSVTGKTVVTLKENETACLGSALFAGLGAGVFSDVPGAAEKIVRTSRTFPPRENNYDALYESYKQTEKAIKEVYRHV